MEADARFFCPHRVETRRLVMFHAGVATPDADAAAMERHVAAIEAEMGRPLRAKIYWVRGTSFGQGGMAAFGLCLGSDRSAAGGGPDDPALVPHPPELAPAGMNQHERPGADGPRFLN